MPYIQIPGEVVRCRGRDLAVWCRGWSLLPRRRVHLSQCVRYPTMLGDQRVLTLGRYLSRYLSRYPEESVPLFMSHRPDRSKSRTCRPFSGLFRALLIYSRAASADWVCFSAPFCGLEFRCSAERDQLDYNLTSDSTDRYCSGPTTYLGT